MNYELCEGVSIRDLRRAGFNGSLILKKKIYHGFFELRMLCDCDIDNNLYFVYDVLNANAGSRFTAYWYNPYGRNSYIPKVRNEVKRELNRLERLGIINEIKK